jgi:glycosyltransferase involved in cell wall biosynthesis
MNEPHAPLVSVITATYNWSTVLRYAIQTVLWQTFTDFEYIIVGDCCTDDTAEVVASFDDPRIRWHNLPQNTGNQAGPNRAGVEMARGQFIAYLNQDDLWIPDHLQVLVNAMQIQHADIAYTLCLDIKPPEWNACFVDGLPNSGDFGGQRVHFNASGVMHRRDAYDAVGGWSDWRQHSQMPMANLWERLIHHRNRLVSVRRVTMLKFNSGERKNSYLEKPFQEQANYFNRIQNDPDWMHEALIWSVDSVLQGKRRWLHTEDDKLKYKPGGRIEDRRRARGLLGRAEIPEPHAWSAWAKYRVWQIVHLLPKNLRTPLYRALKRTAEFVK